MPTNATIFPVNGPAVIWFEDGSSITVDTQERKDFQIPAGSFATVSDAPDSGEDVPAFVEAMIKFWQEMLEKIKQEIDEAPEATPV